MQRKRLSAEELAGIWPADFRRAALTDQDPSTSGAPYPQAASEGPADTSTVQASVPAAAEACEPPTASAHVAAADTLPASRYGNLLWALIGFLVGAAFWHFVGFWGFVSDVVLKGRPGDFRPILQSGLDCTELVLDRASRTTSARACGADAKVLREAGAGSRTDFARLPEPKKPGVLRAEWSPSVRLAEDEERAASPRAP